MNAKEEKILALLKEKNTMFELDVIPDIIDEDIHDTYIILEYLRQKGKIVQIMYDDGLFFMLKETASVFEKKRKEFESEFGIEQTTGEK